MKKIPIFDHNTCTLCKKCISICPHELLYEKDGKIFIDEEECMLCSHCYSICPEEAVSFHRESLIDITFKSISGTKGESSISSEELISLLRSRRSIRRFREKEVPKEILQDMVSISMAAPSGSNCQNWSFTIISSHRKVWDTALSIKAFFKGINKLVKNPLIRYGSVPFMGKKLINYHKNNLQTVERAIALSGEGIDLLFHGAPALIIYHSEDEGSTPREDAQYASYNAALLAHTMGLGTCYIGYAVEAFNRSKGLKGKAEIPLDHRVHAVLAAGYPAVSFQRPALRKPAPVLFHFYP